MKHRGRDKRLQGRYRLPVLAGVAGVGAGVSAVCFFKAIGSAAIDVPLTHTHGRQTFPAQAVTTGAATEQAAARHQLGRIGPTIGPNQNNWR